MSDEPSFDFLPWEELPVGVRRNRKKMYNYLVSVLGGDTPTPTGTVTVTCQDSEQNLLSGAIVVLLTENAPPSPTNAVGGGLTGEDGTTLLYEFDEQGNITQTVKQVEYGDYYLMAHMGEQNEIEYGGALTVDGDEEVTITLTEA